MSVGRTKFRPDEGFGHIMQHVGARAGVLSVNELNDAIGKSAADNEAMWFPVDEVVGYKAGMGAFKPPEGIQKHLHIAFVYMHQ